MTSGAVWDLSAVDKVIGYADQAQWEEVLTAMDSGLPVNAEGVDGRCLVHAVVMSLLRDPAPAGLAVLDHLLRLGVDPTPLRKGRAGAPLVSVAAMEGSAPVLHALVRGGARVDVVGFDGRTPLHSLAWSPYGGDVLERAAILLEQPSLDVDSECCGMTAARVAGMDKPDLALLIMEVCSAASGCLSSCGNSCSRL